MQAKRQAVKVLPAQVTPRPMVLNGITMRERTPLGTAFITINSANGKPKDPFESLYDSAKPAPTWKQTPRPSAAFLLILRLPSPMTREQRLREVIDQLEHIGGSRFTGFGPNRVRSLPDGIARALSCWWRGVGSQSEQLSSQADVKIVSLNGNGIVTHLLNNRDFCPRCRQASLITEQGCLKCTECGYKEC